MKREFSLIEDEKASENSKKEEERLKKLEHFAVR